MNTRVIRGYMVVALLISAIVAASAGWAWSAAISGFLAGGNLVFCLWNSVHPEDACAR